MFEKLDNVDSRRVKPNTLVHVMIAITLIDGNYFKLEDKYTTEPLEKAIKETEIETPGRVEVKMIMPPLLGFYEENNQN